jgi:hypothetical protein
VRDIAQLREAVAKGPKETREASLLELLDAGDLWVLPHVTEAVKDESTPLGWLASLFSGVLHFSDVPEQWQQETAPALLGVISRLLAEPSGGTQDVREALAGAFKAFAILAPCEFAGPLVKFLWTGRPEVTQMALFAIRTIFTGSKPCDPKQFPRLSEEVRKLAGQVAHPGTRHSPVEMAWVSRIAEAMGALGDPQLKTFAEGFAAKGGDWEKRILSVRFQEVVAAMKSPRDGERRNLLTDCVKLLEG